MTGGIIAAELPTKTQENPIFASTAKDPFAPGEDFLDVDDAFILSVDALDNEIILRWELADGYYLYKHRFSFSADTTSLAEPYIPEGIQKTDEYFGDVEVYYHHVEITVEAQDATAPFELEINYQGCADAGLCYTPTTRYITIEPTTGGLNIASELSELSASVEETGASKSETFVDQGAKLGALLDSGNLFWVLLSFVGAGLLLTFTPCVLPMIPILSSIIAGQGKDISTAKAFKLSFVYVQAMAITYAILGVLIARAGSSLSGYMQSPLIISIVAIIFILLALSMFGLYELKLPQALDSRLQALNQKQKGGQTLSVAIMGALSTLIVSPCTTAPLTAALLYIANTGSLMLGGMALYALGIGMGIPLLIVGVGGGKFIPKAGAWMVKVKMLFGFMMLAMALYISDFLIPGPLYLLLWGILLVTASVFLGAFSKAETQVQLLGKSMSLVVFLIGGIYLVGAAMGNDRLLRPLANLGGSSEHQGLSFTSFKSKAELESLLTSAKQNNQPVMLDFFAEWCVACYEFEDYTFSDEKVQDYLSSKNVLLLQADVTANDKLDRELLESYKILGLPSILFFDSRGVELPELRATGFESADLFIRRLKAAFD